MYPWIVLQRNCVEPVRRWKEKRKTLAELSFLMDTYVKKNSELLAENIALHATLLNAKQVEELMGFTQRYKASCVCIAQVLLRKFLPESHFFLLDAGANRGVCPDMVVVCNNCLVGRVSEVYPYYCRVMLITDQLSKVPAVCVRTDAHGIYEGAQKIDQGNLTFVSHLSTLEQGDLVLSSGEGLVYPKGFALGTIESFTLDRLGLNYEIAVKPINNFKTIHYCCIIQKGAEYEELPVSSDITVDSDQSENSIEIVADNDEPEEHA